MLDFLELAIETGVGIVMLGACGWILYLRPRAFMGKGGNVVIMGLILVSMGAVIDWLDEFKDFAARFRIDGFFFQFILEKVIGYGVGFTLFFYGLVKFIHRHEEIDEKLTTALARVTESDRAKSEFLSVMSHELRTPLNAVIGFGTVMAEQQLGPLGNAKYREYARDIQASGAHLMSLVNDLLDFSAIDGSKTALKVEGLSVHDMVAETFRLVAVDADRKGVRLIADVSESLSPLYADRRAIRQVLLNLISNGIKYMGRPGTVTLAARESAAGEIVIEVIDTGAGIAADQLPKVTEIFYRSNADPQQSVEGWGLGLAISKSIVERHRGSLKIRSAVGEGTTVTVTLPNDLPETGEFDADAQPGMYQGTSI